MLGEAQTLRCRATRPDDRLLLRLADTIAWLEGPLECAPPCKPGKSGRADSWSGGACTVRQVQDLIRRVAEFACEFRQYELQRLVDTVVRWLHADFIPVWQRRKQAEAVVDFDDQLEAARNLLVRSVAARREFQERFKTLLVDEFQDTDPTQLEIVLLLASPDLAETDPARLKPGPGRLFVVGDPKQSIYRFRGADVETYLDVVRRCDALGLERVEITTNFRSVPSILHFADEAFTGVMAQSGDGAYQGDYLRFGGAARQVEPAAPSIRLLGDRTEEGALSGSGRGHVDVEAARLAKLIAQIKGDQDGSWWVEEARGLPGRRRPPEFRDIAILLPALTHVDALEEQLRDSSIPYVLEGGKFYYARSEVSSALTLLRAVSNPNDEVALYGALRSIFFGISDEDLLRARVAGVSLDYRIAAAEGSPLCRPFAVLRELHEGRLRRPPSETFERLLQGTGAREVLAVRGFQSIANLNKLGRTLRWLQERMTFSEAVDTLLTMHQDGIAEGESRVMEETGNAVRILSIHKAKGLDFPIVLLAGLGGDRLRRTSDFLADAHRRKIFAIRFAGIEGPGWRYLKEEEEKREDEELIRLLYVALTRARDHLVLSTHHRGKYDRTSDAWSADFDSTRLRPLAQFLSERACRDESLARFIDGHRIDALRVPSTPRAEDGTGDWVLALRRESAELARLRSETPAAMPVKAAGGALGEARAAGYVPDDARARALRFGVAYHEAMEAADFGRWSGARAWAGDAARRHHIDGAGVDAIEELVRNTLASPLIERARQAASAGRAVWRELPFVRQVPGAAGVAGVEEGKIDLLFQEEGGWVLVDYKTDKETPGGSRLFAERYRAQILAYRAALRELGVRVTAAYLLLARTGEAVEIDDAP